jgi:hypothetical protein
MRVQPNMAKAILHNLFHDCDTGVKCQSMEEAFILDKLSTKVSHLSAQEISVLQDKLIESGLIKPIQDIDYWKNFAITSAYEFKELLEGFKEAVIELADKKKNESSGKSSQKEDTSFICNDKDCKLEHHNHSSRKASKEITKKVANGAIWAWGIFAACVLGLIGLIVNGLRKQNSEEENPTQAPNSRVSQLDLDINSSRRTNSKIIPISSSSSRSPRVNSQAVIQTKNSQKNSQDPNPQNQAA